VRFARGSAGYAREYDIGEVPTGEDLGGRGVIGAHALNANTGSVGVALLGTFSNRQPTTAAMNALEDLLAWKADLHAVTISGFERGLRPSAETWVRLKKALREALAEQARKVAKAQKDIAA